MFQIQVPYQIHDLQTFSPILWVVCFLDGIVCRTEVFYFDDIQFILFLFLTCAVVNHHLAPRELCSKLYHLCSSSIYFFVTLFFKSYFLQLDFKFFKSKVSVFGFLIPKSTWHSAIHKTINIYWGMHNVSGHWDRNKTKAFVVYNSKIHTSINWSVIKKLVIFKWLFPKKSSIWNLENSHFEEWAYLFGLGIPYGQGCCLVLIVPVASSVVYPCTQTLSKSLWNEWELLKVFCINQRV